MPKFGANLSAGVQINEADGGAPIQPSRLGWVGYTGILERGPVGKMIVLLNAQDADRKTGGYVTESLLPDAIRHFFGVANGAGGVLAVRITDGNEVAGRLPLYMRRDGRTQFGYLEAHNGGAWAGKAARYSAEASLVGDINPTTIDTGVLVWSKDQWKGATLELAGVPNKQYKVVANTTGGLITVAPDSDMEDDLASNGDPTNKRYYMELTNGVKFLSARVRDGESDSVNGFAIDVQLSDGQTQSFSDLTFDNWLSAINDNPSNYFVKAVQTWEGDLDPSCRPANHFAPYTALSSSSLTAEIFESIIDSAGGGDVIVTLPLTDDSMDAQTITLSFTNGTNFTAVSDKYGALGAGTVGAQFNPPIKWCPSILVNNNNIAMSNGDTIAIVYKPLVAGALVGGYIYPDQSKPSVKFRVIANTHKIVSVQAGSDMATIVAPTFGVKASGQITFLGGASLLDDENFILPRAGLNYENITFFFDKGGAVTPIDATHKKITVAAETAAQVAALALTAINAVPNIRYDPGTIVGAALPLVYEQETEDANVAITDTVADVGFIVTGMTGGVEPSDNSFRAEYFAQFSGGRDGNADVQDSHYIQGAFNVQYSPFNTTRYKGFGLIKFATPGVTATLVQQAGLEYIKAPGVPPMPPHQFRYEVPSQYVNEADIDDYITNTLGRHYLAVAVAQGRCDVTDPQDPKKRKTVSTTGFVHGREARIAANFDGYHKAEAGLDTNLPGILSVSTGDAELNEEFLNPRGIAVLKKRGGQFIIWGNKTLTQNGAWGQKSIREQFSHYEHTLTEALEWVIFQLNTKTLWANLAAELRRFFKIEFNKSALYGDKFEDAATIKIDTENNLDDDVDNGLLNASIMLRPTSSVEKLVITLGKMGVTTNQA